MLELNKQRDQISVLQRDVEAAQRNFEAVSTRSAQTRLESHAVQTNISMLNPASVPSVHSRPRILLNVLIAIFTGTLLGVGIALSLELVNRRVLSTQDIVEAVGLPVLAVIPSAVSGTVLGRSRRRLFYRKASRQALGLETP